MGSPVIVVTRNTPLVTQPHQYGKMNSEEFKSNAQHSEKGYSFVGLIFGAVMVAVGYWIYQLNTETGAICQNFQRKKRGTHVLMEPPIGCTLLVSSSCCSFHECLGKN